MHQLAGNHPSLTRGIKLLKVVSYGFLIFAAVWWLAVYPAIDKPAAVMVDILDWPLDGGHDNMGRDARFFSAIGAGLVVGLCGFLLLDVVFCCWWLYRSFSAAIAESGGVRSSRCWVGMSLTVRDAGLSECLLTYFLIPYFF